jgi:ATP-dependent phosphofructokinase / diphosphate-dependent phosphofructokinase
MTRRIAVLTGGGDVPGLNVAIKTLTWRMVDAGVEVLGLRRGWASVLALAPGSPEDPADWMWRLDKQNTRTIDRTGGTFLHTSRTNPAAMKPADVPAHLAAGAPTPGADGKVDLTAAAIRTLEHLGVDVLVAIGGDDTLSFARRLHEAGAPVVAIPKTMDNDVRGTDFCIGFSTAVTRSVEMITALRTPAGSHERFLVVELFGRNSGETSLITALLAGADRALISECPYDPDRVVELLLADRAANPSHYAVVTISEGAHPSGGRIVQAGEADAFGHQKLGGIGQAFGEDLKAKSGVGIMFQSLGYLMRGGPADTLDRMVAINFARIAGDLALRGQSGQMTAVLGGRYATTPLDEVGTRKVDVARYYDAEAYRPKLDSAIGLPMFLE